MHARTIQDCITCDLPTTAQLSNTRLPAPTRCQQLLQLAACNLGLLVSFVTLDDLKTLQGPEIVIHHPEAVLDSMNEWCQEHHNKSGLVQRVRDSTVSLQEAEQQVCADDAQEGVVFMSPCVGRQQWLLQSAADGFCWWLLWCAGAGVCTAAHGVPAGAARRQLCAH